MSEIRIDPVTGKKTTIFSENYDFKKEQCPSCRGVNPNELEKLKLIYAERNEKGLVSIAFPSENPLFAIESSAESQGVEGIYDCQKGHGAHEWLISFANPYEPCSLELMFKMYRHRINDLCNDKRIRHVQISRKYSPNIPEDHLHSQLIAMPNVPSLLEDKLNGAFNHYEQKDRCIFCDIIHEEKKFGKRIVFENHDFIAYVPFTQEVPYELDIFPKKHCEDFGKISDDEIASLTLLIYPLKNIKEICDRNNSKFTWYLYTAPFNSNNYKTMPDYWHWHLKVIPEIDKFYNEGIGMYYINKSPEQAAAELRTND